MSGLFYLVSLGIKLHTFLRAHAYRIWGKRVKVGLSLFEPVWLIRTAMPFIVQVSTLSVLKKYLDTI